jgi:hypothetical protein
MELDRQTFYDLCAQADTCLKSARRLRPALESAKMDAARSEYNQVFCPSLERMFAEVEHLLKAGDRETRWREFREADPGLAEAATAFADAVKEAFRHLPRTEPAAAHLAAGRWGPFWAAAERLALSTEALRQALGGTRPGDDEAEFRPAGWFAQYTSIPGARLRQAATPGRRSKRVRKKNVDGVVYYSAADARRWWPQDMERKPLASQ